MEQEIKVPRWIMNISNIERLNEAACKMKEMLEKRKEEDNDAA